MTEPADYTAKIRAKGLDATGITEDLAGEMYRNKGRHYMAIVEIKVDETHEKADGARKVDLVLTQVEPATSTDLEEHLRELTRVGYFNRQRADGQLAIDDSLGHERTVADVVASGRSLRPHPFLPDDAAKDNPICDVCGGIEASAVHSTQDILDDPETEEESDSTEEHDAGDVEHDLSEDERPDLEQDEDPAVVEYDAPHTYDAGPDDVCQCGLPFEHDLHAPTPAERHLTSVADPFAAPAS